LPWESVSWNFFSGGYQLPEQPTLEMTAIYQRLSQAAFVGLCNCVDAKIRDELKSFMEYTDSAQMAWQVPAEGLPVSHPNW